MLRSRFYSLAATILLSTAAVTSGGDEGGWHRIKLDDTFRSEGAAAADVNRDGRLDVIAGDVWYEAPADEQHYRAGQWKMHEIRTPGRYVPDQGYSNSFANFARDVNGDGWEDAIIIGFPGAPCHWYENPQNEAGHWKEHVIWHSAANESPEFEDLTPDDVPELIVGSEPERQLGFLKLPDPADAAARWEFFPVSEPGDPNQNGSFRYYHGLGIGDLNNDGRMDVLIPHGWYEAPRQREAGPWTFHPLKLHKTGETAPPPAANLHAYDFDLDGDNDIVMSSAHNFGIWWFENTGGNEQPEFKYHLIDESYSQTHALELVDINGDGHKDLVTGKRYFAHQGNDPGGRDPVVMYWYEVRRTKGQPPEFIPHEIVAGRDTGVGTQFQVADMNGDERPDLVLSNKKGVNVLVQSGPAAAR